MAKKKTKKKKTVKKKKTKDEQQPSSIAGSKPASTVPPKVVPMPTAGRKVTEFEDRLDSALAGDGESQKRGRGRPRKDQEPVPAEIDVTIIGQVVQIPFDLWSISQGVEGLKISPKESVMIAKPLKTLLDYYMPQVPEIAWAWISLSAVSYSVMKSRLVLIAEIKKQKALNSSSGNKTTDAKGSPEHWGQGGSRSSFPSFEEIKKQAAN